MRLNLKYHPPFAGSSSGTLPSLIKPFIPQAELFLSLKVLGDYLQVLIYMKLQMSKYTNFSVKRGLVGLRILYEGFFMSTQHCPEAFATPAMSWPKLGKSVSRFPVRGFGPRGGTMSNRLEATQWTWQRGCLNNCAGLTRPSLPPPKPPQHAGILSLDCCVSKNKLSFCQSHWFRGSICRRGLGDTKKYH